MSCEINLSVIKANLIRIRRSAGVRLMLMAKADAYGHGIREVGRYVEDVVDAFGVATVEEGEALREAGVKKEILITACAPSELDRAVRLGLTIGVYSEGILRTIIAMGCCAPLHIKVNSGMNRLGFEEYELPYVLDRLDGFDVQGVYSHLRTRSPRQLEAFRRMSGLVRERYPDAIRHLASTHSYGDRRFSFDMVRVGLAGYEGSMCVTSCVLLSRRVRKGEYVSYGDFVADRDMNTAVVFGGYADGIRRERPSGVYIRSKKCRTIGRVCMDMQVVDTGDFLAEEGEKAVLYSPEFADELCHDLCTIEYTLMTAFKGRIERTYVEEGGKADRR